jgi:hypothetical protein
LLWTLAILSNFFSSASLIISMSLWVLLASNTESSPACNPILARANCRPVTCSRRVSPAGSDYLHRITSRERDKHASTLTLWGMIYNISCTILQRLAYIECISSGCRHQSVVSSNQNVQPISIGSEWELLHFSLISPRAVVIQKVHSNSASPLSLSVLHHRFIQLSFQPHCEALSILHHRWTNHIDHMKIDQI